MISTSLTAIIAGSLVLIFIGALIGVILMCAMSVASDADDAMEP